MSLSKKHYERFAKILRDSPGTSRELIAAEMVKFFSELEPDFDRLRFMKAAGATGTADLEAAGVGNESVSPESGEDRHFLVRRLFAPQEYEVVSPDPREAVALSVVFESDAPVVAVYEKLSPEEWRS